MSNSKSSIVDVVSTLTRVNKRESYDCKPRVEVADYMHSQRKQPNPHRRQQFLSPSFKHQLYHHAADPIRQSSADVEVLPMLRGAHGPATPTIDCINIPIICPSGERNGDLISLAAAEDNIPNHLNKCSNENHNFSEPEQDDTMSSLSDQGEWCKPTIAQVETHLAFLREKITCHHYNQGNYLQMVDSLLMVGTSLPSKEILNILEDILQSDNCYFIKRISRFLSLDSSIVTSVEKNLMWDIIRKSLSVLKKSLIVRPVQPSKSPGFLAGKVTLEYIFKVFVNDLRMDRSGNSSVLEQVLSLTSKFSWHNNFLDVAFYVLSELEASENIFLSECVGVMLHLSLLTLVECTSKAEQKELSFAVASDISKRINELPTTYKKHFVLIQIPSDSIRLKVIDIHLDNYFIVAANAPAPRPDLQPFSFVKIREMHLNRSPLKADGTTQEMGYFLCLLALLLQSHLLVITGVPMLAFFPELKKAVHATKVYQDLKELHHPIMMFINRLSSDPVTSADITTPTNWCYLELLITLTS